MSSLAKERNEKKQFLKAPKKSLPEKFIGKPFFC
jgi:hypothetical protein